MEQERKSVEMKDDLEEGDPNTIKVSVADTENPEQVIAQTYLNPTTLAASSIKQCYAKEDNIDVNELIAELGRQSELVHQGDLKRAEAMLIAQAHTLDNLFFELAGRSRGNMSEHFHAAEKLMRLALKAQSQCRTTLEALSEIKNPKPYIQNNQAQYQQVNNGEIGSTSREKINGANELLEENYDEQEWLDTRAPEAASGNDKVLEAVEEKHRPKDGRR